VVLVCVLLATVPFLICGTIYVAVDIMHNGWSDISACQATDDDVYYVDQAAARPAWRYVEIADEAVQRPICYGEPFGGNAVYASGYVYVTEGDGSLTRRDWSWQRQYVGSHDRGSWRVGDTRLR